MTLLGLGAVAHARHGYSDEELAGIKNGRQTRNDRDSFYWPADVLCRIIAYFGSTGSRQPGLLRAQTEEPLYEMMWLYAEENTALARPASTDAAIVASSIQKRSRLPTDSTEDPSLLASAQMCL